MRSMIGILREEMARLLEAEKSYKKEIASLPKGSFQQKRINGKNYLYLACRKGHHVVSKYLGRFSSDELKKLSDGLERRKRLEKLLKDVRNNLKNVRKMVCGRKRTV